MPRDEILQKLARAVANFDADGAERIAKAALEQKLDPLVAIEEGLAKGIKEVGDAFDRGEAFLPELVMAAEAMKAGMRVLSPAIERGRKRRVLCGVVIGTIAGDIHDLGKNIVASMLEANGFEVDDLGVDVPPERFIAKIKEVKAKILAMSALLPTTMPNMRKTIEALEMEGIREKVKVMVGGGPVTKGFAESIGADAWGADATDAVKRAKEL